MASITKFCETFHLIHSAIPFFVVDSFIHVWIGRGGQDFPNRSESDITNKRNWILGGSESGHRLNG
jgi:hypothetical protein